MPVGKTIGDLSAITAASVVGSDQLPLYDASGSTTYGIVLTEVVLALATLGLLNKTLVDAKGDLLVGTAADTIARIAAGANNTVLVADSGQAEGVKWQRIKPTQTVLTVGSGTYNTPAGCTAIIVEVVAGGGGGGGSASSGAGNAGAGGGGASGGYLRKLITTPAGSYSYTVGAKGTGGATGNNGNPGNDSTFSTGTVYTAKGGGGGALMATGTAVLIALNGAPGTVSTNGDVNSGGVPGGPGIRLSGTVAHSGAGGASYFGGAAAGRITNGAGAAAINYGSGGAGGCSISSNQSGGDGSDGVIVVTEFYG